MTRRQKSRARILCIGVTAGFFIYIAIENVRIANAFETKFDVKSKSAGPSGQAISFKSQVRDSGWLSINADGSVLDLNPMRSDMLASYGFKFPELGQSEKSSVTDTRVTLGFWNDQLRWTSRQAISSYVKPGTDLGYLRQNGSGFDDGAMSQRVETGVFKTDSLRLSLFAEYAKVGTYFAGPDLAIKRQDIFFKSNSTTTRYGGIVERGPITFTLEQRANQSLAQDQAPIHVQNQISLSFSIDQLLGRSDNTISWVVPSSAWLNIGQGIMKSSLSQGVASDTTSDVSVGLSWALGNINANLGYWQSDYKSQLYPWKGSGLNGSLGYYQGTWGVDLYFDISSSAQSYAFVGTQQPTTSLNFTSGLLLRTKF